VESPGHAERTQLEVDRLAATGEFEHIVMNRAWSTATGRSSSGRQPDLIAIRRDNGRIYAVEVQSRNDEISDLSERLRTGQASLPPEYQNGIHIIRYPYQ
jgi:hypothetical protein